MDDIASSLHGQGVPGRLKEAPARSCGSIQSSTLDLEQHQNPASPGCVEMEMPGPPQSS